MATRGWNDVLLTKIVEHLADVDPKALYAEYPVLTMSDDQGYRKIS